MQQSWKYTVVMNIKRAVHYVYSADEACWLIDFWLLEAHTYYINSSTGFEPVWSKLKGFSYRIMTYPFSHGNFDEKRDSFKDFKSNRSKYTTFWKKIPRTAAGEKLAPITFKF